MTRVATAENEDLLLTIALHGKAAHVERAVRQFRRARRNEALDADDERHARRRVVWRVDEDGCWALHARFTPEQGERIMKAIDAAVDEIEAEQENGRVACNCVDVPWVESGSGATLDVGRRIRSIPPAIRRALQRRDQGCRFPGCTAHKYVDAHHVVHWADGGESKLDNLVTLCRHHTIIVPCTRAASTCGWGPMECKSEQPYSLSCRAHSSAPSRCHSGRYSSR